MWKFIAKLTFYGIALVTLCWTGFLTYSFVSKTLSNLGPVIPALSLIVFDGGMISWLVVFLHHAEGAGQRGLAIGLTLFDLIGVGLMAFSEILLGGQTMIAAPVELANWALYGIAIWTIGNVAGVVLFHLFDPVAQREMALKDAQDTVLAQTFEQLKIKTANIAAEVADRLSTDMVNDTVRELTSGKTVKPEYRQSTLRLNSEVAGVNSAIADILSRPPDDMPTGGYPVPPEVVRKNGHSKKA
jgi:hypothetical protein